MGWPPMRTPLPRQPRGAAKARDPLSTKYAVSHGVTYLIAIPLGEDSCSSTVFRE